MNPLPREGAAEDGSTRDRPAATEVPCDEAKRLRTALEDVVALAHSAGDHRERVILMQRRAMAALSGVEAKTPGPGGRYTRHDERAET